MGTRRCMRSYRTPERKNSGYKFCIRQFNRGMSTVIMEAEFKALRKPQLIAYCSDAWRVSGGPHFYNAKKPEPLGRL